MADYVLRGTERLLNYKRTLAADVPNERLAAAIRIPVGRLAGKGLTASSYTSRRYSEAEAQALAGLLGVEVADVTTNGGQEVVG